MAGKFNGHKNWNHWNVSLWLMGSDEYLYKEVRREIQRARTLDGAAKCIMQNLLGNGAKTGDGAPYTFTSVRAAIKGYRAGMRSWL